MCATLQKTDCKGLLSLTSCVHKTAVHIIYKNEKSYIMLHVNNILEEDKIPKKC